MMVASIVIARAFMILENAISQSVQVLGFIRLGLMPNTRKGTENCPRDAIGLGSFCQQDRHSGAGSGGIAFPRRWAINLAPRATCGAGWGGSRPGAVRWRRG